MSMHWGSISEIYQEHTQNFTKFSVHVAGGHGSIFSQHYNTIVVFQGGRRYPHCLAILRHNVLMSEQLVNDDEVIFGNVFHDNGGSFSQMLVIQCPVVVPN